MADAHRTCSSCGRPRPVELEMTVHGSLVTLLSCTACDQRTWLVDGQPVPVQTMLAFVAGDPDFVLSPHRRPVRTVSKRALPAQRTV